MRWEQNEGRFVLAKKPGISIFKEDDTVIELRNVSKVYDGTVAAVRDVSLHIEQGEIFGMIGVSGAGKSTFLRCINLLECPTAGQVWVDGVEMTKLKEKELRVARQKIGMIFQHFNILSSRTVAENIEFPLEIVGVPKTIRKKRVEELLDLVGLTERAHHYPSQLSGGQKQRVGIARALANEPRVLLCDEATSALDPMTTRSVLQLIYEIRARLGLTVVLITHEMDVIQQICDRMGVMDQGEILEMGPVQDVFAAPQMPITRQLLGSGENEWRTTSV